MSNYYYNQKKRKNDSSYPYNNSNHTGERSPIEKDKIQIFGKIFR